MNTPSKKTTKKTTKKKSFNIIKRLAFYCIVATILLVFSLFAAIHWLLIPNINIYKHNMETILTKAIGYQVKIKSISAKSSGLSADIFLNEVSVSSDKDKQAIRFANIEVIPSWVSVIKREPQFSIIRIEQPDIDLRLDAQQNLYLNGINLTAKKHTNNAELENWILSQEKIVITKAKINWQDDYRHIKTITLNNGSLNLSNHILSSHHQLQIQADEISNFAQGLSTNISWYGSNFKQWRTWYGDALVSVNSCKSGGWTSYLNPWVKIISGNGNISINTSFQSHKINALNGSLLFHGLNFKLSKYGEVYLPILSGKISFQRNGKNKFALQVNNLNVQSNLGYVFNNANLALEYDTEQKNKMGNLSIDKINIKPLQPLIKAFYYKQKNEWANTHPEGFVSKFFLNWSGDLSLPNTYKASANFEKISLLPHNKIPGFTGITGNINISNYDGALNINSQKSSLKINTFKKDLAFNSLQALLSWNRINNQTNIDIESIKLSNDDLSAQVSGKYKNNPHESDYVDINAQISNLKAINIKRYIPFTMGKDIQTWLNQAFINGQAKNINMILRGDLNKFPFNNNKDGKFEVTADLDNVDLQYSPDWPHINKIVGNMQFLDQGMTINVDSAISEGTSLSKVKVKINDLSSYAAKLTANGVANGQLTNMLNFAGKIPIDKSVSGFLRQLKGKGTANIDLQLNIPLGNLNKSTVNGNIHLKNNSLTFKKLPIPELTKIKGNIQFNNKGISSENLNFSAFAGKFSLNAFADTRQHIKLQGYANSKLVSKYYISELEPLVSGRSFYKAQIDIGKDINVLNVSSNLNGTALKIPSLLNKPIAANKQLDIKLTMLASGDISYVYSLDKFSNGYLNMDKNNKAINGLINIGSANSTVMPANSIAINVIVPELNIDKITNIDYSKQNIPTSMLTSLKINLNSKNLYGYGHQLHNISASLSNNIYNQSWQANIKSKEIEGDIYYLPSNESKIKMHLKKLDISSIAHKKANQIYTTKTKQLPKFEIPELEILIDNLIYKNNELGKLKLNGKLINNIWFVPEISLSNADGILKGSLEEFRDKSPHVKTKFIIESSNIGNLLNRCNLKDAMKNGSGHLKAELNWQGKIADFDESKLSGQLDLDMENGQFLQIDPGAARLLSVLSLQSLIRHAQLNFSDVFGKGLAFYGITGSADANNGIFHTKDLFISSTSANIYLTGSVNLGQNTQDLTVKVNPNVSGSVAITAGAITLNPLIGIGTFVAQKILQDPFSKILSQEYKIEGTFDNPVVKKINK